MKRFKQHVVYALLALVALFTKACDCDRDPAVFDNYCVEVGTQAVSLQPGASQTVTIKDAGGCEPVGPVLPWTAQDLDAPRGINASDPLTLGVDLQNANSASGASVRLTNFAGDVLSVMPNFQYRRYHTVKIDLAGPGKPNHKKTVYGSFIHVELVAPAAAATSDQVFAELISAAPTAWKFVTTGSKVTKTFIVANRSSGGGSIDVRADTSATEGAAFVTVAPDGFTLRPKGTQAVLISYEPFGPKGSLRTGVVKFISKNAVASVVIIAVNN
ncbi:MAG TPA: hypothetical protein VGQ81_13435 [Acidobacteriota bacterium]|nr:hypothetical protein [Acidobacteriota bacterium]